ncbi:MAG: hypothetical protein ACK6CU_15880 [Deltaproteobacteria bacterium]
MARLLGAGKRAKPSITALTTPQPLPKSSKPEVVPTPRATATADAWLTQGPPRPSTPAEAIRSWDDAATESRAAGRAGEARYCALVAQAAREVEAEVMAWATANQEPDFATRLIDDEELAVFAFLAPHWRRSVLAVAGDVYEVIDGAASVDAPNARSAVGRKGYGEARALSGAPVRPGREDDEDDDPEPLEVLEGPPSERVARKLVDDVIANEVALRVTERAADGVRTYVLFPDAVRKRGQQIVMVGEDEGGASRVVTLPDIVKLEVIAD